jgi:hypothetical protein
MGAGQNDTKKEENIKWVQKKIHDKQMRVNDEMSVAKENIMALGDRSAFDL